MYLHFAIDNYLKETTCFNDIIYIKRNGYFEHTDDNTRTRNKVFDIKIT